MSEYEQELEIQAEEDNETIKQQAERIAALTNELAGAITVNNLKDAENQRLKECAEMGLEANAEKAKEIKRLKDIIADCLIYKDDIAQSVVGRAEKELKAAQPQGGSDV